MSEGDGRQLLTRVDVNEAEALSSRAYRNLESENQYLQRRLAEVDDNKTRERREGRREQRARHNEDTRARDEHVQRLQRALEDKLRECEELKKRAENTEWSKVAQNYDYAELSDNRGYSSKSYKKKVDLSQNKDYRSRSRGDDYDRSSASAYSGAPWREEKSRSDEDDRETIKMYISDWRNLDNYWEVQEADAAEWALKKNNPFYPPDYVKREYKERRKLPHT